MIELRLKVSVNNISVMSRLLPEEGERKEEWDRLKGPDPHQDLPQVKQISSFLQARYDRVISMKAAAKGIPPYHPLKLECNDSVGRALDWGLMGC